MDGSLLPLSLSLSLSLSPYSSLPPSSTPLRGSRGSGASSTDNGGGGSRGDGRHSDRAVRPRHTVLPARALARGDAAVVGGHLLALGTLREAGLSARLAAD